MPLFGRLTAVVQFLFLSRYFMRVALYTQPTGPPSGCFTCCLIGAVVGQSLFLCFLANQRFIFVTFSSAAPHRGQPAAKCHPRWQPTRRLAVSCGLGARRILTRDCRTTAWRATIEPSRLPDSPFSPSFETLGLH